MLEYNVFLEENAKFINFINKNNLIENIENANNEAIESSNWEDGKFLHSYRYSKVYDVIKESVSDISLEERGNLVTNIVNLLENPFNKKIEELVKDLLTNENGLEIR